MGPIKYLNPIIDVTFKKLFSTEKNKPLVIHFLNSCLNLPNEIKNVEFHLIETKKKVL